MTWRLPSGSRLPSFRRMTFSVCPALYLRQWGLWLSVGRGYGRLTPVSKSVTGVKALQASALSRSQDVSRPRDESRLTDGCRG